MSFSSAEIKRLLSEERWTVSQSGYKPVKDLTNETLFALSNGYVGVRASLEEGAPREQPGTFFAGVFDGSDGPTKNLVNAPSWLGIRFAVGETQINPMSCEVVEFGRCLDMRSAVLFRHAIYRCPDGRETRVEGYRFLSLAHLHRAAVVVLLTPLNWDGLLTVESTIDGEVANLRNPAAFLADVDPDDATQRVSHLRLESNEPLEDPEALYLEMATRERDIHIAMAATLVASTGREEDVNAGSARFGSGAVAGERLEFDAQRGVPCRFAKYVVERTLPEHIHDESPRDHSAAGSLRADVAHELRDYLNAGLDSELTAHQERMHSLWEVADVAIEGDERANLDLRYNVFQLLTCYTGDDPEVSIGAKALGGEGYRGQAFWDTEVYLLPFYVYTNPEAARSLLLYRYNRLDAARAIAKENGLRGAQFPWNSADTGQEESTEGEVQTIAGDKVPWYPETMLHVTGAVAYGVERYVRATADDTFLIEYGAEMLLETALMWVSRAAYNAEKDRYELNNVVGHDEYHPYVDNNFYTNALARWNIRRALSVLDELKALDAAARQKLVRRLGISAEETEHWADVAEKLYMPVDAQTGVGEQFEGYFKLRDMRVTAYDENNMPTWPDGFPLSELKDTQFIKQADVVMAMYLLDEEFDEETIRRNYNYYLPRTVHKSTLSAGIYSIVALRLGEESEAYDCLIRTAEADLVDSQGSTWQGPHIASAGGTWQAAVFGFAGMSVDADGMLAFRPRLPDVWRSMTFSVIWRGTRLSVHIARDGVSVTRAAQPGLGSQEPILVRVNDEDVHV